MKAELFLSEKELSVITDTDFLLAKAKIIAKIQKQFGQIRDELKSLVENSGLSFPEEVDTKMGKISKGENYQQLPFVVLDYPKLFTDKSVFSFRTMFWWGNFFSFTLHLGGRALENYRHNLIDNIDSLKNTGTYICTNSTPWEYHYKKDNYVLIDKMENDSLHEILENKDFIKLSRKIGLTEFKGVVEFCKESFSSFLAVLAP